MNSSNTAAKKLQKAAIEKVEAMDDGSMSVEQKADLFEQTMTEELEILFMPPQALANPHFPIERRGPKPKNKDAPTRFLMGDDPRLPKMPEKPTLIDFFKLRWYPAAHLLQSANLAMEKDLPEKVIMACLLHDVSVNGLIRSDHGYWGAQLIEPYVDEEVSWAVRYHQVLRFFPDDDLGYVYPELYKKWFGADYVPPGYIQDAYEYVRSHKWYMSARLVTMNDLYAFDPDVHVEVDQFADIIGRNFRQPAEGLGFDKSPVAHMWRTMIWPNNFL